MAINTFSIHFVLKEEKVNKHGLAPIFAKIRLNGKKIELSTGRNILPSQWISKKQKAKASSDDLKQLNEHLDSFKTKLYSTYSKLLLQEEAITVEAFKDALKGKVAPKPKLYTLLETATEHNQQFQQQIGEKYSYGSYKNYKTTLKYLYEFLPTFCPKKDLPLASVDFKFCEAFFTWLITTKNCHTNGANKQIQRVKKILNYSIRAGYLSSNPTASYSLEFNPHQKVALQLWELKALQSLKLQRETLREVRDVFLFQCYTGLSYADLHRVSSEHVVKEKSKDWWIRMKRQKTGVAFAIPLLQPALDILQRYSSMEKERSAAIFPVLSNQKMNQNLKLLQELAGISKNLTTHLARHTFATTITLSNGVPIETVSRMLGHTKLSTTQVYAKVLDGKIEKDMKELDLKLAE